MKFTSDYVYLRFFFLLLGSIGFREGLLFSLDIRESIE